MSLFTHLECSIPCGAPALDPHGRHFLCPCGAPLLARYDLDKATAWSRETLRGRVPNMWRYRELMPLFDGEEPITLGEGFTPLVHARALGATIGLDRLYIKDESLNPTNSFKARGQSAAITRAKYIGAQTIALPTAGNAGNAAAAYSAAAGLACEVFIPKDAKKPFVDECRLYGANATIADGLRVPRAIGDFLILRAIRESGGTALAVPDRTMVDGMLAIGKQEGISAAPEGGAALEAVTRLVADGSIKPQESVVLFNT